MSVKLKLKAPAMSGSIGTRGWAVMSVAAMVAAVLITLAALPAPAAAAPASYTCEGTGDGVAIPPGIYQNLTITGDQYSYCYVAAGTTVTVGGNVTVTPDAWLDSRDGTLNVQGNVVVQSGGNLVMIDGDQLAGNLIDQAGSQVTVWFSEIHGTIDATGQVNFLSILGNKITGNVVFHDLQPDPANPTELSNNNISGNVRVLDNAGTVHVGQNTIQGALACIGNVPAPDDLFEGLLSPNTVSGAERGQCASL